MGACGQTTAASAPSAAAGRSHDGTAGRNQVTSKLADTDNHDRQGDISSRQHLTSLPTGIASKLSKGRRITAAGCVRFFAD
jgi:hypothetical protein